MTSPKATLANWRTAPFSQWAFGHVDELIPVATIAAAQPAELPLGASLNTAAIASFDEILAETETDGFMVLQGGKIIHESYRHGDAKTRHILFSVSKPVTGILAGILVGQGKLDPEALVTRYVPEVKNSAYGTATVRHVLDMTVGVSFGEDYFDTKGAFAHYRDAMLWNPPNPDFGGQGLHAFLATLPPNGSPHGEAFHYVSPNCDLLGWIVERAGAAPIAQLLSALLWKPMGAAHDAYITVDAQGASRTAGGMCMTLADMARFGELIRLNGKAQGQQIVPESWIADIWHKGDPVAWQKGDMTGLFPQGRYRSQWYVSDEKRTALCAIGIHGQWIYIDPNAELVIAKHSSQQTPEDTRLELLNLTLFEAIAASLKS
ncbi:serine hydrolase domain-containing protein [Aestuariivirga litoralis]|uniref:serine hydrolase domain-containing protein n=1 Tax=Aestuariivirga litoralis TaxID=2650924 RepID=UPI0018C50F97|nr:serine hydrolase [Aestuariivirga litoralis]MBG1233581.1 serine hydrolase [Aestuariivirga litoralis]